ncbi:outer membrane protein assembly factor BamD [Pelagibacteraceae bacterium]|nr:outer membrane protein assembly factor BamD [Pelagibacteraceae bacterium]
MFFINLKKNTFFILTSIFLIITACGKDDGLIKKPEEIPPLNVLYKSAFDLYEQGDWSSSIELFQKVETRYSFSEWAPRATLMIMYIYYEAGESIKALEYANKFKKTNPRNKNINYVDFIIALTFYERINVVSRDQTNTRAALKQFQSILKKYPNSIYAEESKYKIDLINEQLAGNEMYIGRYYMKKGKWIAAIKRFQIVINQYDTTIFSKEALHRLVEIYYRLGNINEAKKYAAILGYNFNDSNWYKKSYKIVGNKDYRIEEKKQKIKLKDRVKKIFSFSNDK